jgi:hypothetical protein
VFAALMLARDIYSNHDLLAGTGLQHRVVNDSSWSKKKAISLRGDVAVIRKPLNGAGGKGGGKGEGGGKGKKYSMVAAAAAASTSFSRLLDDGLGAGVKECDNLLVCHHPPGPTRAARLRPTKIYMPTKATISSQSL